VEFNEMPRRIHRIFPLKTVLPTISISVALSQIPAYTARPKVHHAVCLFTIQLALLLAAPTHRGMVVSLSSPGWLAIHQGYLYCCRWSPIPVLTGPNVEQLCNAVH